MKTNETTLANTLPTSDSFSTNYDAWGWIVQYGLRVYGFVILTYLLVTAYTGSFFMADTEDYVASILAFPNRNIEFWDFGHILWRPLGWIAWELFRPVLTLRYKDPASGVALVLIAISWISGFASALLVVVMLRRYSRSSLVANVVSFGFIGSQAFLNYVHTGSPYVPGLLFLVVATLLMVNETQCGKLTVGKAVVAGLANGCGCWAVDSISMGLARASSRPFYPVRKPFCDQTVRDLDGRLANGVSGDGLSSSTNAFADCDHSRPYRMDCFFRAWRADSWFQAYGVWPRPDIHKHGQRRATGQALSPP
jgi:hypothetical protein